MQLFVRGTELHVFDAPSGSTIGDVRAYIALTEGADADEVNKLGPSKSDISHLIVILSKKIVRHFINF